MAGFSFGHRIDECWRIEADGSEPRRMERPVGPSGLVGLFGSWKPVPAWTLAARADFGVGDRQLLLWAAAQWHATPHLVVNLGWRHVDARLEYDIVFIGVKHVSLHYRASGPQLSAQVSF